MVLGFCGGIYFVQIVSKIIYNEGQKMKRKQKNES